MKIRLFAIRLIKDKFLSDQKSFNDFLETIDFVKSDTHFVEGEINYWSVLLHFKDKKPEIKPEAKKSGINEEDLNSEQYDAYKKLKVWRAKKAEDWNIPSFMICHNSELLEAIVKKPKTTSELRKIKGFGDLKVENHGEEIILIINAI